MSTSDLVIDLEVAYVGYGGNTGGGQYFYSYLPHTILAKDSPTTIKIQFSAATSQDFEMYDMIASDGGTQLSINKDGSGPRVLDITNQNSVKQLIIVDILVKDTARDTVFVCDPQVINRPR